MFIARYGDPFKGQDLDSYKEDPEFLKQASKDGSLYCPYCSPPSHLYFVLGDSKNPHFVHHYKKDCKFNKEKESSDHKETKRFLTGELPDYNELEKNNSGSLFIRQEMPCGGTRPDVFLILKGGYAVGVEYQRFEITEKEFLNKLNKNTESNISTIYILKGKNLAPDIGIAKDQLNNPEIKKGLLEESIMEIWGEIYIAQKLPKELINQENRHLREIYRICEDKEPEKVSNLRL